MGNSARKSFILDGTILPTFFFWHDKIPSHCYFRFTQRRRKYISRYMAE